MVVIAQINGVVYVAGVINTDGSLTPMLHDMQHASAAGWANLRSATGKLSGIGSRRWAVGGALDDGASAGRAELAGAIEAARYVLLEMDKPPISVGVWAVVILIDSLQCFLGIERAYREPFNDWLQDAEDSDFLTTINELRKQLWADYNGLLVFVRVSGHDHGRGTLTPVAITDAAAKHAAGQRDMVVEPQLDVRWRLASVIAKSKAGRGDEAADYSAMGAPGNIFRAASKGLLRATARRMILDDLRSATGRAQMLVDTVSMGLELPTRAEPLWRALSKGLAEGKGTRARPSGLPGGYATRMLLFGGENVTSTRASCTCGKPHDVRHYLSGGGGCDLCMPNRQRNECREALASLSAELLQLDTSRSGRAGDLAAWIEKAGKVLFGDERGNVPARDGGEGDVVYRTFAPTLLGRMPRPDRETTLLAFRALRLRRGELVDEDEPAGGGEGASAKPTASQEERRRRQQAQHQLHWMLIPGGREGDADEEEDDASDVDEPGSSAAAGSEQQGAEDDDEEAGEERRNFDVLMRTMHDDENDEVCDHEGASGVALDQGSEGKESKQVRRAVEQALNAFWTHAARGVRMYAGNLEHIADIEQKKCIKESGQKRHQPDENAVYLQASGGGVGAEKDP